MSANDPISGEELPVVFGDSPAVLNHELAVEVHGLALTTIATVALLFALQWAQTFCLAVLLGIFVA